MNRIIILTPVKRFLKTSAMPPTRTAKRILLVDPHEITREGYMAVLSAWNSELEFDGVGTFPEALQRVTMDPWDLIILELCMPGRSGLELLDQIAALRLTSPVLISSLYDEDSYGIRAIRRGVGGYICKAAGVKEFLGAVQTMLDGRKYLSPNLVQSLMSAVHPSASQKPHESLSDREFQVLQRLACGASIKNIAAEMCLSAKTVSTYRTRILQKLGVSSMVGLVEYCLEHRLTSRREAEESKSKI